MKWINYLKDIPEPDQSVLVINKPISTVPIKAFYDAENDAFISLEAYGTPHALSITHWMPLPKPPKE